MSDSPLDVFEPSEVLERYRVSKPGRRSALPANAVLDEIPEGLPGCADEKLLARSAKAQGMGQDLVRCADFLAGRIHPKEVPGAPSRKPFMSDFMRHQLGDLVAKRMLKKVDKRSRLTIKAKCGLFAVEKAGKFDEHNRQLARIIFDARDANARLAAFDVELIIFTLALLIEAMFLFLQGYAYSVDMRHYYYQWMLPVALQLFFVIITGNEAYLPTVLAMGYRDACVLAQAASWILTFRRPDWKVKGKRLRRPELYARAMQRYGEDLGVPRSVIEAASMPAMVWLRDQDGQRIGAIFVLLDGIFVLTNDVELRNAWQTRIEQNLNELSVVFKAPDLASATGRESSRIEFAGVVMHLGSDGGIRPKKCATKAPSEVRTHRDGAILAGELVWILRVRRADPEDFLTVLRFARHVGLFRTEEAETSEPLPHSAWDRPLSISHAQREELQSLCRRYATEDVVRPPLWQSSKPEITLYAVTDANLEMCAFILLDWAQRANPDKAVQYEAASSARGRVADQSSTGYQCWAEGWATADLLDYVTRSWPGLRVRVLLVVDANPIMAALNKGYSSSGVLTDLIGRRLQHELVDLIVGRVPGPSNLADLPSRNRSAAESLRLRQKDALQRLEQTVASLESLAETLR